MSNVSVEATIDAQPIHELSTEPTYMITSDSDVKDENFVQTNLSLDSSAPFVLESILESPFEPNQIVTTELLSTDQPRSLSQTIPQLLTTNVSPPPTLLLDYVILKDVCENIF